MSLKFLGTYRSKKKISDGTNCLQCMEEEKGVKTNQRNCEI
jgi:hypothetical protein